MSLIARLLTRMVLIRLGVILFGLCAFVVTLEIVSFLTDILRLNANPLLAVITYALARLPGVISLFLPTSMLLALLLVMTELSYRNELTAIWATGISPSRLIVKLLPLALIVGTFHFVVMDRGVPAAAPALRSWGIGDYATRKFDTAANDPVWIRSGNDIMRAERVSSEGDTLFNVIIFRREPAGQLQSQIFAESALQKDGNWLLNNVTTYYASGEQPSHLAQMVYQGPMRLASNKVAAPEEMTLAELSTFIANDGFGVRPVHVYKTWWQKRLTPPFIAVVMLILCVPLGTSFRRGGGLGLIFAAGVALGFVYFIADGVAMTLGEQGTISPWMAAWGPLIVFAAIAVALMARTDHV
ncbi:MAG: LptF/LptG family permease [Alphaproteobacteria bacterium]|nr:LptF/LptG family permease [Alphaproteobacteria bacterium]